MVGLCPFHAEKTPSFSVNPELGLFKCFGCGKGGDLFSFVQYRENVDFKEALQILADRVGVELQASHHGSGDSSGPNRADVAKVNGWAQGWFSSQLAHKEHGAAARDYLAKRGFEPVWLEKFEVGLATSKGESLIQAAEKAGISTDWLLAADLVRRSEEGGRLYETFRDRVIFPIRDATKRVVGFGGRTLVDDRAKYLNTAQNILFDKSNTLFGINLARDAISKSRRVVIVEGYTDCLAAHQVGSPATVATLGTALTESHVDLLRRYADEVILLFDSDQAGDAAAQRAINVALPRSVRVRLARLPQDTDPCEFLLSGGEVAFSDVLKQSVDALEFKWSVTVQRFCTDGSDRDRREAVLDFLRTIADACRAGSIDVIQRGLMVNQVAHLLRMDGREVDRLLSKLQAVRPSRPVASQQVSEPVEENASTSRHANNEEQSAWRLALEAALAEPAMLIQMPLPARLDRISDARDRRIANVLMALSAQLGEFSLAEVLSQLEKPEDAARTTELVQRGQHRENHEATLQIALEKLDQVHRLQAVDDCKRVMQEADNSSAEWRTSMELLQDNLKNRRHFNPRRLSPHSRSEVTAAKPIG